MASFKLALSRFAQGLAEGWESCVVKGEGRRAKGGPRSQMDERWTQVMSAKGSPGRRDLRLLNEFKQIQGHAVLEFMLAQFELQGC